MTPRLPREFTGDARAQASTIGVVLVLAITLTGATVVVAVGSQALEDTERATSVSKAEHSMTQFDSRVAMVALGETSAQRVTLSDSADGQYAVNPDAGWIRVVHKNYTGTKNEVVYDESLGSVTYENGDVVVAYQGGGVWRQQDGGTTMLSPPEFHYRGATLTLPVVRVASSDGGSGPTTAFVTRVGQSQRVFPNETASAPDGAGAPYDDDGAGRYANPVLNGTVEVTVHSDYYRGWADYFRTRTAGTVTVDSDAKTATVELQTVDTVGEFPLTDVLDDDGMAVRGQSPGHSVTSFEVAFEKSHGTFNNMYYAFHAESGPHRYETVVHIPSGVKCNGGGVDAGDELELHTFYRNTDTGEQHEWENTSVTAASGPIRVECSGNRDATLVVNLTSSTPQHYRTGGVDASGTYYDWSGSAVAPTTFDHSEDSDETYDDGSTETTRNLTQHYVALMGDDFTLNAETGPGNRGQVDVDASGGTLDYEAGAGGYYITYLHITENEVRVELE